jgi:predicted secreted protein
MKKTILLITLIILSLAKLEAKIKVEENSLTVPYGKDFSIELSENPTTGYLWNYLTLTPETISFVFDQYFPMSTLFGSRGTHIFYFRPTSKGKGRIQFINRRPWEPTIPARAISYDITIE